MGKKFNLIICLFVVFLTSGCFQDQIDGATQNAVEECRKVIDDVLPQLEDDIWEKCTTYYEEEVIPQIEEQFNGVIDEIEERITETIDDIVETLQDWFNEKLEEVEKDVLTSWGCIVDPGSISGWDCNDSWICEELD
tara:strand:+ start:49 stop:459 length:411 start_codon:yes stop_codon:yes gene_type:complete